MKIPVALIVLAVCGSPVTLAASEQRHREWMNERADVPHADANPPDAATALLFQQHLCGADRTCFSDARWRKLDRTAVASNDPVILAVASNVESYRDEHDSLAARWAHIAALDPGNAYPLLLEAAARWKAGEQDAAMFALRHAAQASRLDDYLASISALVYRRILARPPTLEQLHPCALVGDDEQRNEPAESERVTAEVFDISMDGGVPAHIGDIIGLCKQEPVLDAARAELCMSVGKLMTERAPSQLMRSFGFALQRFATSDDALRASLMQRQQDDHDELYRKLWWVESSESSVRSRANVLWMHNFTDVGELRAADSLIERFGEPPHEDRAARQARADQRMKLGQECYARYRHD